MGVVAQGHGEASPVVGCSPIVDGYRLAIRSESPTTVCSPAVVAYHPPADRLPGWGTGCRGGGGGGLGV